MDGETGCRTGLIFVATITIGAELTIAGIPDHVEYEIIAKNTFANPDFDRKERLGLWTGETDEYLELWRRTTRGLVVPLGGEMRLRESDVQRYLEIQRTEVVEPLISLKALVHQSIERSRRDG